jgi:hypothetical protein
MDRKKTKSSAFYRDFLQKKLVTVRRLQGDRDFKSDRVKRSGDENSVSRRFVGFWLYLKLNFLEKVIIDDGTLNSVIQFPFRFI